MSQFIEISAVPLTLKTSLKVLSDRMNTIPSRYISSQWYPTFLYI
nr:MAG TPA: hypothetical protein [Bacteriophage sp.]